MPHHGQAWRIGCAALAAVPLAAGTGVGQVDLVNKAEVIGNIKVDCEAVNAKDQPRDRSVRNGDRASVVIPKGATRVVVHIRYLGPEGWKELRAYPVQVPPNHTFTLSGEMDHLKVRSVP